MSRVRIILGDPVTGLDLADPTGPFEVYASSAQGTTDLGNPVPITETVESGLQDGTIVRWLRDDNRKVDLFFGVKGNDLDSLARAIEFQVVPLTSVPTLLTIYPPDEAAEPGVFEVWTSALEIAPWGSTDLDEVRNEKRRMYSLTLTAQPYVRSLNPVTIPALAGGGGAPVVIDAGTSAAGWTSSTGVPVTASGGVLSFPVSNLGNGVRGFSVTKTIAARNFTTTPYVYIELQVPTDASGNQIVPSVNDLTASPGGSQARFIGTTPSLTTGYATYWFTWFSGPPTAATTLQFTFNWLGLPASTTTIQADNVTAQGDPPSLSGSSPIRTIPIKGSRRTPGSLRVTNCSILYTAPRIAYAGYDPGAVVTGSAVKVANIPIGGHQIVASGTLQTTVGTAGTTGNVTVVTTFTQGTLTKVVRKTFPIVRTTTVGQITGTFVVGSIPLPLQEAAPGAGGTITATMTVSNGLWSGGTFKAWSFWMGKPGDDDHCALSIPNTHLTYTWFDAPTWDRPYPGVWTGNAADKSDAVSLVGSMERWGDHQFMPGYGTIYVVGGQATFTQYMYWHMWPPKVA